MRVLSNRSAASLVLFLSIPWSSSEIAAHVGAESSQRSFHDFANNFVEHELIVMFRDDTGHSARKGLEQGFALATGRPAASSHPDFFSNDRVLMFDLDSDGDQDILLAHTNRTSILLRNDAGTLVDISEGSGIPGVHMSVVAASDFDGDGDIDIFAGGQLSVPPEGGGLRSTYLLCNNGDETFTDVFAGSGLSRFTFGIFPKVDTVDYDNDGDTDLVVIGSDPLRAPGAWPSMPTTGGRTHIETVASCEFSSR